MPTMIIATILVKDLPEWAIETLEDNIGAMDEADSLRFLAKWMEEDDFITSAAIEVIRTEDVEAAIAS